MNSQKADLLTFYDISVSRLITENYNTEPMQALKRFILSETHLMLEDDECGFYMFGAPGIFDIWENEIITGDPRNSIYIRGE